MSGRPVRVGELAAHLERDLEGDADRVVRGVATLEQAGPEDLVFARSARFAEQLAASAAGAVILPPGVDAAGRPAIRSPQPDLDFARAAAWILPARRPAPGVHPSATVAADARIDPTASVEPHAVVGSRSTVGPRSVLHPHVVLYEEVHVGADCVLHAGCVLREGTEIGDRVILHPGVVLGGDGYGYTFDEQGAVVKVPQVGRVVVDDDVEIGANTTVDRATLGVTRIRSGAKLDNLVQVAHNCDVGESAMLVAQSGLAGSTIVGRRAFVMAQAGSAGHLTIGDGAFVGARAGVHKDVSPGSRVWGTPQMEERAWSRTVAALGRLPDALRRLRAVERRLGLRKSDPDSGDS